MNYRNLFIGILIFFSFFLIKSGLIVSAQYDEFGGYDYYYENSYYYPYVYYDYDYYYYDNGYVASTYDYISYSYPTPIYPGINNYPATSYEYYSYPLPPTPGTNNYPIMPYEKYNYPSIPNPSVNNFPIAPYTDYVYLPVPTPGLNSYPVASYGNYNYPSLPNPAVTDYPISFGSYQNLTTPSVLAAAPETVVHSQSVSEIPTGPDGMLPWIFLGGLVLSILSYLIFLVLRLKMSFKIISIGSNKTVLERRLEEIRSRELKPDTNDLQF